MGNPLKSHPRIGDSDIEVQTADIQSLGITTAKIAASAVTTAKIADDAVTTDKLDPTTIQYASVSITNAEMLALRATPKTLVAAPGAGYFIEFVKAWLCFDRAGAYTETADNMAVKWADGSGSAASETIEATGFVDAAGDAAIEVAPRASAVILKAAIDNQPLVLHNTGDGEYGGGNASNVVRARVAYRIHAAGW